MTRSVSIALSTIFHSDCRNAKELLVTRLAFFRSV